MGVDTPPHDTAAESAVLGSILKDNGVMARLGPLEPVDFYEGRNRLVFAAMRALHDRFQPIGYVTLGDELTRRETHEQAGGILYLSEIDLATPTAAHAGHYAEIVRRTAVQRRLISAAQRIAECAWLPTDDVEKTYRDALGFLHAARPTHGDPALSSPEVWAEHFYSDLEARIAGQRSTTPLPWGEMQQQTAGGFSPGELVLLMATSGSGKTELALQMAMYATQCGPVIFGSLEMSDVELAHRYARINNGLNPSRLAQGKGLTADELSGAATASNAMSGDDLWPVCPAGPFTTSDLRARCIEVQARTGRKLALVVGDYAQRFADTSGRKNANREQDMALVAENLKSLSRELKVPVLVPIQPNRAYEGRADKRPHMADLRESGRFEIEADWILGVYRPDKHEPDEQKRVMAARNANHVYWPAAEVHVLKNRSGRGDTDGHRLLRWNGAKYVDPSEMA